MFCTTSETEGVHVKLVKPKLIHYWSFQGSSLVVVWGVRVSVAFHLTCVHIIFSSVWVVEWPPFGK